MESKAPLPVTPWQTPSIIAIGASQDESPYAGVELAVDVGHGSGLEE